MDNNWRRKRAQKRAREALSKCYEELDILGNERTSRWGDIASGHVEASRYKLEKEIDILERKLLIKKIGGGLNNA